MEGLKSDPDSLPTLLLRDLLICLAASASGQAFPYQAYNPLDAAEEQGALQSQILPIEFEMALLIRPHPVGEEGGLDVVHDGLFVRID